MPRHSVILCLRVFFFLLLTGTLVLRPADAAGPWDRPAFATPARDLLSAAQEIETPQDAPVHMLLFETEYTLADPGVTRVRERQVYRVLNDAGARGWSTVQTDWFPWYQKRPEIRARVVTPEGVHELDPDAVGKAPGTTPEPSRPRDERILEVVLPEVTPGAVVELEIVVEHTEPYSPAGETRRHWLAMSVPVHRARVILDAPADLDVHFRTVLLSEPEPVVTRTGDRVRRTCEQHDVAPLESIDPGLPPEAPLAPYVAFSTGKSWSDVARAYSALVDEALAGSDLAGFAADGAPAESQWERTAELLAGLHRHVRFTGVPFGDGGIVPRAPDETLERREGDGADQAALLAALLRREGIPAYLALLYRGFGPDLEPELPGLGLFNHAVVYVPGATPLWIDPTDPYTPLGSLPLADAGRWALVAAPNTRELTRTPDAESRDHHVREERRIYLADPGPARIVEISEIEGHPAREIRSSWDGAGRDELQALLSEYVASAYGARKLVLFHHTPLDDPTAPLELRLEAEEADYAVTDADEGVVVVPTSGLFQRLPEAFLDAPGEDPADSPRRQDFFVYEPHRITWRYEIHIPERLVLEDPPASIERALGPLHYTRRLEPSEDGRRLLLTLELDTGPRRYSPKELDAVRRGLAQLEEVREGLLTIRLADPRKVVPGNFPADERLAHTNAL